MTTTRHRGLERLGMATYRLGICLRIVARLLTGLSALALLTVLIAGVPYGLWRFVGWPLPEHIPSLEEIEVRLTQPMSDTFLLNILACILWPVWAAFTLDVARAAFDELRALELPRAGPLQGAAAALVGAITLAVVGSRPAAPDALALARPRAVVSAPLLPHAVPTAPITDALPESPRLSKEPTSDHDAEPGTVVVRPPRDGVYDSLWRVAERELGSGLRWPEIYALNEGARQPDGRTLTQPALIHPGWILRLPQDHPQHPEKPAPPPRTPPSTSPPPSSPPSPASPSSTPAPSPVPPRDGIELPIAAYVGLGLAALVTIAACTRWILNHVNYRRGSGQRRDLAVAPIIRTLRAAHDEHTPVPRPADIDVPGVPQAGQRAHARATAAAAQPPEGVAVGTRDGRTLAIDLARTRGLGLIGPGSRRAARALLLTLLAQAQEARADRFHILMTMADAENLLGNAPSVPDTLHVLDDLNAALDELEAELLTRTREVSEGDTGEWHGRAYPDLVLVATPGQNVARLQAVLDNGSSLGIACLLLGQWRPGGTLHVGRDGTVGATSPGMDPALVGARLFYLPEPETHDVLQLLHDVDQQLAARTTPAREPSTSAADDSERLDVASPAEDEPRRPVLRIDVVGSLRITYLSADNELDITAEFTPRQREILIYLVLHAKAVRRDVISGTLWPEGTEARSHHTFQTTLSQLRRRLRDVTHDGMTDIAAFRAGSYILNPAVISDLWQLREVLRNARHAASREEKLPALEQVAQLDRGELAADQAASWLEEPRETLHREVLDALSELADLLADSEPARSLEFLERIRDYDPYDEGVYVAIAGLQHRLGRYDAVSRTLAFLTRKLAEIDTTPSVETTAAFTRLQRRRNDTADGAIT